MKIFISLVAVLALLLSIYNFKQNFVEAPALTPETTADSQYTANLRQELIENPDIVINAIEAYRTQQVSKQQDNVKQVFTQLQNSTDFPVMGNKDSDVTLIEFYDYNCGACRIMADTINQSLDDAKYILVDFPILSSGSRLAAQGSYAAKQQGKFDAYHMGLLNGGKPVQNEETLLTLVGDAGLDVAQFKKDYSSDAAVAYVQSAMALAENLNLNSTPSLIVNGRLIVSALRKPQFDALLKEVRKDNWPL